jgi:hypothetical protein
MKIIENITLYRCDFCRKELKRKHAMVSHELRCYANPVNYRPCLICEHLDNKDIEFDTGTMEYNSGEPIYRKAKTFYCKAKDILLLHPKTAYFTGPGDLSCVLLDGKETNQEQMPVSCEVFDIIVFQAKKDAEELIKK